MGGNGKQVVKNIVARILDKITGKLTKENKKSDHEHLTIKIEGVENVNSFLAPTYLENLKKAINEVSIRKNSGTEKTKTYWEALRGNLLKEITNLINCFNNSSSINRKISDSIKKILNSSLRNQKPSDVKKELVELNIKKAKLESDISKNNDKFSKDNNTSDSLKTKFDTLRIRLQEQFKSYCENIKDDINSKLQRLNKLLANSSPIDFKNIKSLSELKNYINSINDTELRKFANEALSACETLAKNVTTKSHQYKSFDEYILKCFSDFKIHTGVHREKSFIKKYGNGATTAKTKLSSLSVAVSKYDKSLKNSSDLKSQIKALNKDLETLNVASDISKKYDGNDPVVTCYRNVFEIFDSKIKRRSDAEKILNSFCCEKLSIDLSLKEVIINYKFPPIDIEQLKKDKEIEKTSKEIEKISKEIKEKLKKDQLTEHMKLMELVSPVENLLFQKKSILETATESLSSIISKAEEFKTNVGDVIKTQHNADSKLNKIKTNAYALPSGKVNLYAFVEKLVDVLTDLANNNYKGIRASYDSTINIKKSDWKKYNDIYDKVFPERKNLTIFKDRYELCLK